MPSGGHTAVICLMMKNTRIWALRRSSSTTAIRRQCWLFTAEPARNGGKMRLPAMYFREDTDPDEASLFRFFFLCVKSVHESFHQKRAEIGEGIDARVMSYIVI